MAGKLLIDILPLSLLALFLWGIKFDKSLHSLNFSEDYISVETGKCYRGFFAVVIVLHHLALLTDSGFLLRYFVEVGYLAVSYFFFISGYGLQKSYITKRDGYRKGFLLKRIPTVLIPYIVVTALYWLMYRFNGKLYSLKDIFVSIFNGTPIVSYSWYIISIIMFYVVYWLIMLICRKRTDLMLLCAAVWYVLHVIFCVKIGYGRWWYCSSQLLVVGMFWASYESKIIAFLKKFYLAVAPAVWVAFIVLYVFTEKIVALTKIPTAAIYVISAILFTLSVILFSLKFKIGNKVLSFLGGISLEIYLAQGLFIALFRGSRIYIENDLLWCVAVLFCTVAFSYLLHIALRPLMGKYKLLLCKLKSKKS